MAVCLSCGKVKRVQSYSRHKKGSSGAGGVWALRAPIYKKTQRPNLHNFKGEKYCTKCLRIVKKAFVKYVKPTPIQSGPAEVTPQPANPL